MSVLVAGSLTVGTAAGYYAHPLLHPESQIHAESAGSLPIRMMAGARMVAVCNFDSNQLDQLAGRIAPLIARQVNSLDGRSDGQMDARQQTERREQEKAAQVAAFSNATHMVDQMIASRHVSHEGVAEAIKLLQQSGQADRAYELQGRIAVAMNRGELTPEESGMMLPPSAPNRMR